MAKNKTLVYSIVACLVFIGLAFLVPEALSKTIASTSKSVLQTFGPFYLFLGLFVVLLLILLALLPIGKIKLGGPNAQPEFGLFSWIAMLYSTGMGAGLLLRAVQEPVYYFTHPPVQVTYPEKYLALEYTFFHWGLTPWAFYGIFGLIISYYLYKDEGKLLASTALMGTFRRPSSIHGLDSLTTVTTVFGVVGAVGLGASQIAGGINHLTASALNLSFICLLVLAIGGIATGSAMTGLGKGIKYISNLNMAGATFLLAFVLFQSNWATLGSHFFTSILFYLRDFIPLSLNMGRYHASPEFMADWTYFYWAFWLAWTPFTGIFIARISKGRTIRQFVLGTLLVPAFGTFLWFTAFGSNAMEQLSTNMVSGSQYDSIFTAIFLFFEHYPGAWMLNILTVFLLFTFLITSIDSAIFVLSMFTDNGNEKPGKKHGILWGIFLTVFTIALLFLGDGNLLQMVSQILVLAALPFGFILFFMTIGFIRKISRP